MEEKIENLNFNLRYMNEVIIKWQKNFKLIGERFSKLEKKVNELMDLAKPSTTTTTTTTTNSPRQIQEPDQFL